MTKREAIVAAAGAMIGLMSDSARAESTSAVGIANWNAPQKVTFNLDDFESFTFTHDGKSVTVTPRELFQALSE